ncbi:hypothetical protein CXG81DRAFT_25113 [Caulochytrium protostelioides]|uniref:Protein transport protein BOS1 n=1 Tax=Caulochytrium protostelioides TaxID=1555241 RepID=A0A4P9XAX4_9FUNG|nr:hypothetical protein CAUPRSCDRAFT_6313 [Caulochytrium protostelioides]RKP02251.1 hypothetical protein CXG81DRAFT_25113 [Caulochytrium protostelioides]|eukprot:RKP02251.1 hypothetical protein CXG81DRAFT_25113 [Caulochytrium protostelioides]
MSAVTVYAEAQAQLKDAEARLQACEAPGQPPNAFTPAIQHHVSALLGALLTASSELNALARREMTTVKREKVQARAAKLRDEQAQLRSRYDALRSRYDEALAQQQRHALLGSGAGGQQNDIDRRWNAQAPGANGQQNGNPEATILMMDGLLHEHNVLQNTGDRLDDYIGMGRQALEELYEQRSMLKGTQRRLLDIANSLGLSTTLIRYIERRSRQDQWFFWGGVVACLFGFYLIVHFIG